MHEAMPHCSRLGLLRTSAIDQSDWIDTALTDAPPVRLELGSLFDRPKSALGIHECPSMKTPRPVGWWCLELPAAPVRTTSQPCCEEQACWNGLRRCQGRTGPGHNYRLNRLLPANAADQPTKCHSARSRC